MSLNNMLEANMSYYYKVVEILDEYTIAINYGRNSGAAKGAAIRVISFGPEIIDLESKEVLGTLDTIKATLSIEVVYDGFSICRKIAKRTTNMLVPQLPSFSTTTYIPSKLNVDHEAITNKQAPDDLIIRVGDTVEIL